MALTTTPQDIVDYIREHVQGIPMHIVDAKMIDQIHAQIWRYYPWDWTLVDWTSALLVDKSQTVTPPANVYRPLYGEVIHYSNPVDPTRPIYNTTELSFVDHLASEVQGGSALAAKLFSYEEGVFRLPHSISVPTNHHYKLKVRYQRIPTKITDGVMNDVFDALPDHYQDVMMDGVLWKAYVLFNDKRQGAVIVDKSGRRQYTGQMGVFLNGLQEMLVSETAHKATTRYPHDSIGEAMGGSSWPYGNW